MNYHLDKYILYAHSVVILCEFFIAETTPVPASFLVPAAFRKSLAELRAPLKSIPSIWISNILYLQVYIRVCEKSVTEG